MIVTKITKRPVFIIFDEVKFYDNSKRSVASPQLYSKKPDYFPVSPTRKLPHGLNTWFWTLNRTSGKGQEMIMRTISAKCLSLILLLGSVVSEDVSDLAQSDLATEAPASNLLSVEEDERMSAEEDLENIEDINLSEIYLSSTPPGNIENEILTEREENNDAESEPDISRLVAVKIPIINLSGSDFSKIIITQTTESTPVLPKQKTPPTTSSTTSGLEAELDISHLVEVKIPIINLSETIASTIGTTTTTASPTTTDISSLVEVKIPQIDLSDSDSQVLKTVVTTTTTTTTTTNSPDSSIIFTNTPIEPVKSLQGQSTSPLESNTVITDDSALIVTNFPLPSDDESEPDISSHVGVKIPIINLTETTTTNDSLFFPTLTPDSSVKSPLKHPTRNKINITNTESMTPPSTTSTTTTTTPVTTSETPSTPPSTTPSRRPLPASSPHLASVCSPVAEDLARYLVAHPTDCTKFISCQWLGGERFRPHVMVCPLSVEFDSNLGICNYRQCEV